MKFSPDDHKLAVASFDGVIDVYDVLNAFRFAAPLDRLVQSHSLWAGTLDCLRVPIRAIQPSPPIAPWVT